MTLTLATYTTCKTKSLIRDSSIGEGQQIRWTEDKKADFKRCLSLKDVLASG
jgi:hypothetical protein